MIFDAEREEASIRKGGMDNHGERAAGGSAGAAVGAAAGVALVTTGAAVGAAAGVAEEATLVTTGGAVGVAAGALEAARFGLSGDVDALVIATPVAGAAPTLGATPAVGDPASAPESLDEVDAHAAAHAAAMRETKVNRAEHLTTIGILFLALSPQGDALLSEGGAGPPRSARGPRPRNRTPYPVRGGMCPS